MPLDSPTPAATDDGALLDAHSRAVVSGARLRRSQLVLAIGDPLDFDSPSRPGSLD